MPTQSSPPTLGPFAGLNPSDYFGGGSNSKSGSPFYPYSAGARLGSGLYGLPKAFSGWSAPARYAFAPALSYAQQAQPAIDYYKGEMGKDYGKQLYSLSSDIYESQAKDTRRKTEQGLARAGYGGGGAISPFASLQVQQEAAARSGALGQAARESVLQAQAMKSQAANNYMNSIASYMQALLVPAQLQSASSAKNPVGSVGPSLIGPAISALGNFVGAAA